MPYIETIQTILTALAAAPMLFAVIRSRRTRSPRLPIWAVHLSLGLFTLNTTITAAVKAAQGNYWWIFVATAMLLMWMLVAAQASTTNMIRTDLEHGRTDDAERRSRRHIWLGRAFLVTIALTFVLLVVATLASNGAAAP